jgi:tetratricopeptide (TPR) repeat protein
MAKRTTRVNAVAIALLLAAAGAAAQSGREPLARGPARSLSKGEELWRQRLSKSALAAFEAATRDPATAAAAHEAIGRIYLFKGWQQEGVFPGWHDEPEARERAIEAFKHALAIDPARRGAAEALKQIDAFAAASGVVPPAPPQAEVVALDKQIEAFRTVPAISGAEFDALIEKRARAQADPAPFFTAAQIMLERRDYARAADLARRGATVAERFISENESAYRMEGKTSGSRTRMRVASLEILGTVALSRLDLTDAAMHLEEADRLARGQDALVQFRLGELAGARGNLDAALDHYVTALSLSGGPPAMRERAREEAAEIYSSRPATKDFTTWLAEEIERRRSERQAAALKSPLDRPLPPLALARLDGTPVDVAALRGKVLLLNFFSSW